MKTIFGLAVLLFGASVFAATPPLGTWEWVTTEESAGAFTTPGDVGYSVQREFNADEAYNEYRNEGLFRTGRYWVADVEFMGMIIPALYIDCGEPSPEVCAFGFAAQELELYWGADSGGWPSFPLEVLENRGPVPNGSYSWDVVKSLYR